MSLCGPPPMPGSAGTLGPDGGLSPCFLDLPECSPAKDTDVFGPEIPQLVHRWANE